MTETQVAQLRRDRPEPETPYLVEAQVPNMTIEPERFWFGHLDCAIDAARAIAADGRYYWVRVTCEPTRLCHAEFVFARPDDLGHPPSALRLQAVA